MAVFGSVRLASKAPWTQRRRIIGMIKSPVEGSTAALIRLETSVAYSDHVRPVCLPDESQRKLDQQIQRRSYVPKAERLESREPIKLLEHETQQYFESPNFYHSIEDSMSPYSSEYESSAYKMPRAEALVDDDIEEFNLDTYPIVESAPQVNYYGINALNRTSPTKSIADDAAVGIRTATPATPYVEQIWTNCNTLGWSRQRDHLQRVQLKIGDMAACENVSIATVNSMCTEATYQKHDCTVSNK